MPNALSIRPRGWGLYDEVYLADGSRVDLESAERLLILIHGYNNSEADARASFAEFRDHVRDVVPRGELWEFHWPGDHPNGLASAATYPVRVETAKRLGPRLASFLDGLTHVRSVSIVAHSLGCRLALEAAAAIRSSGATYQGPRLEHVFLLAAAVPVPLCDGAGRRFSEPAPRSSEHVFHSRCDLVLAHGFSRGQALVGPFEEGPAVGRDGDPVRRWSTPPVDTSLGHGDYWRDSSVSDRIVNHLHPGRRRVPVERPLPCHPLAAFARAIVRRVVPGRSTRERPLV